MNKPLSSHRIIALIGGTELLGKERGNLEALSALQNQGATVAVAISNRVPGGGNFGEEARRRGFETYEYPMGSHFSKRWMLKDRAYRRRQLKRMLTNSRQLLALIREWRPTHLHIAAHDTFIFFAIALLISRKTLVFRCGDAPPVDSRFQLFMWKWMVRRSHRIVAVSHFIRCRIEEVLSSTKGKIQVIHNIAPSRKGDINSEHYQQLKSSKKPFQLIYVGQISAIKGVKELIYALLAMNNENIGCWIVGGSPHTKQEEELLKSTVASSSSKTCIEWFGFQSDPRVFFKAADWHIAPSLCDEAFGNVVREAQSMGTPSMVSPRGGLPETIIHGANGLILSSLRSSDIRHEIERATALNLEAFRASAKQHGAETNLTEPFENAWKRALT